MKKILILSLLINLLLIGLLSYYYFKKISYNPNYIYLNKLDLYSNLPIQENDIVFIGDSMIEFGKWSELFNHSKIKNRGISGEKINDLSKRISIYKSLKNSKKIFIMIGINDFLAGSSKKDIICNFKELVFALKRIEGNPKIFFHSLLPTNRNYENEDLIQINSALLEICKIEKLNFINLYEVFVSENQGLDNKYTIDGLHLNGLGYEKWRSKINHLVNF